MDECYLVQKEPLLTSGQRGGEATLNFHAKEATLMHLAI